MNFQLNNVFFLVFLRISFNDTIWHKPNKNKSTKSEVCFDLTPIIELKHMRQRNFEYHMIICKKKTRLRNFITRFKIEVRIFHEYLTKNKQQQSR